MNENMRKLKTLKEVIKSCKFDWVNPNIETNFSSEPIREGTKVFHFNRLISSEDAIKEMKKEGYEPANLSELLQYAQQNRWKDEQVVALGSVAEVYGDRDAACLCVDGRGRSLRLFWWGDDWSAGCRFLAVRSSVSPTLELDSLSLVSAIKMVKEAGYKIFKEI